MLPMSASMVSERSSISFIRGSASARHFACSSSTIRSRRPRARLPARRLVADGDQAEQHSHNHRERSNRHSAPERELENPADRSTKPAVKDRTDNDEGSGKAETK